MSNYGKVLKRITKERAEYLAEIEKMPPKEIIRKTYEITCREEFFNVLENTEFEDETYEKLLEHKNILAMLYDEWLDTEGGLYQLLEEMIVYGRCYDGR